MQQLFTVVTDRARLTWSAVQANRDSSVEQPLGCLDLRLLRIGARFETGTWRLVPAAATTDETLRAGPALYEQQQYHVAVRATGDLRVRIEHRDPDILNRVEEEEAGRFNALINFRSQIGFSTFRVVVDDEPEFEFQVEVFPTKLDYRSDYDEILSEVEDSLTGLSLEYLRATWQGAQTATARDATQIEWLTLLRSVANELERALQYIGTRPVRALIRTDVVRRADQVRRVDSNMRSLLRRHARHASVVGASSPSIPDRIAERRAQPTLDTAEHRWLALYVDRVRRRLAELLMVEQERLLKHPSARNARAVAELRELESKANRWLRIEPLAAATELPPVGYASLQLLSAPGYREAYRACVTLCLGLRVEGGPIALSIKDLNDLYEYWCFLALLRILREETGATVDVSSLLEVQSQGLRVRLLRGNESSVRFRLSNKRKLTVRFNPTLAADALVPQRPDILITLEQPDWPAIHLVLDAKYRLDKSAEYSSRYGTMGPPDDALNAMHRYRDAILEEIGGASRRTVVQAAALFPMRVASTAYEHGRLWLALRRIGVGAIPLLPGHDQFLRVWLRQWLTHGGWSVADEAIDHVAIRQSNAWRSAAATPVLIGALRGADPTKHLEWIREKRLYYTPLAKKQRRLFAISEIVFYEPAHARDDGDEGVVRVGAKVLGLRVVRRDEISTPWSARRNKEDQVLYELAEVKPLPREIRNKGAAGRGARIGARRWSSRLAVERAQTMVELFLETEPEWRLYEELRAKQWMFTLRAETAQLRSEDDLRGRVTFLLQGDVGVTWAGAARFVVRTSNAELGVAAASDVVPLLQQLGVGTP